MTTGAPGPTSGRCSRHPGTWDARGARVTAVLSRRPARRALRRPCHGRRELVRAHRSRPLARRWVGARRRPGRARGIITARGRRAALRDGRSPARRAACGGTRRSPTTTGRTTWSPRPRRTRAERPPHRPRRTPMPKAPLPAEVAELFARPNPAVVAVLRPSGAPMSVATWYLVEDDGTVLLNMDAGRARLRWMRERPEIALTALKADEWYTHVSVRGPVVRWEDDPEKAMADIDRLSMRYRGQPLRQPRRARGSAAGCGSTTGTAGARRRPSRPRRPNPGAAILGPWWVAPTTSCRITARRPPGRRWPPLPELRVFDGRATAWLVVQRLLEVVGMAGLLLGSRLREPAGRPVGVDRAGNRHAGARLRGAHGPARRRGAAAMAHPLASSWSRWPHGGRRHPGDRQP